MFRTQHFHCCGPRFDPWSGPGTKILRAAQCGQKKKKKKEMMAYLMSGEGLLPGLQMAVFSLYPHVAEGAGVKELSGVCYKGH